MTPTDARAVLEAMREREARRILPFRDCHVAALDAALSALALVWQPIATAPKDGTQILVWRDSRVHLMRWKEIGTGGFWDEWHAKLRALSIQPTHWMPLPSPPEARALVSQESR